MERTNKKELKLVLTPELYDELRFVFRPDQLENVIYKPEILGENKWQCCCGSESELEICPICGMERHTVFSKVNANYLAHHRKTRIARKRKAMQDQQAMMAAQIVKKTKKPKAKKEKSGKKFGAIVGVLILCMAIIASVAIIANSDKPKAPGKETIDTTTSFVEQTTTPTEDTTITPDTTIPPVETTPIVETTPPEVIISPVESSNKSPATIKDGSWAVGATGNTSIGGLVFSTEEYDFIALDGIRMIDKNGTEVDELTTNKALAITGNGNYLYYIDEEQLVHRLNIETKQDVTFSFKANKICSYFDELYYTSPEETGLFACNSDGFKTKVATTLDVYALTATADKLYFSTSESLAVITTQEGNVTTFCKNGAKATSILEITGWLFYTTEDGKLNFFYPAKKTGYGTEYPIYNSKITYISAYENKVFVKAVNTRTNAVTWYYTTWTSGTKLFNPYAFKTTGITTDALYVSSTAIYDGNLTRKPLA